MLPDGGLKEGAEARGYKFKLPEPYEGQYGEEIETIIGSGVPRYLNIETARAYSVRGVNLYTEVEPEGEYSFCRLSNKLPKHTHENLLLRQTIIQDLLFVWPGTGERFNEVKDCWFTRSLADVNSKLELDKIDFKVRLEVTIDSQ